METAPGRKNMSPVKDRRQNRNIKRLLESLGIPWKVWISVLWQKKNNPIARHRGYLHKILDEHYSNLEKETRWPYKYKSPTEIQTYKTIREMLHDTL